MTDRDDEAEEEFSAVLAEQRRSLGADHADTMATMNSLAMLQSDRGRAEAEPLMLELLETARGTWGEEDPKTLVYEHNLARIYQRQGRDDEAAERNRHVLEVRGRVLGDDNPETLRATFDLAWIATKQGRFEDAESHYLELLRETNDDRKAAEIEARIRTIRGT